MKLNAIIIGLLPISMFLNAQADIFLSDKLELLWETKDLNVPESVLPVPEEGILYVSNIAAGNPTTKEGNGFISILDTNGKVKKLKWVEGLNSPKGMALFKNKLYVSEIDKIAEIDVTKGKKINEYELEGAQFLNDIAADPEGNLYISDSRTGTIHKLSQGVFEIFVQSKEFTNPNGVLVLNGNLILGTGTNIVKIDLKTKEVVEFMSATGGVDGIAVLDEDLVLFSDWPGKVHLMKTGQEKELLLDTRNSDTFKTADFGYLAEEQHVFIPTFFGNSVICYKLKL